jgi:hypothetical protein
LNWIFTLKNMTNININMKKVAEQILNNFSGLVKQNGEPIRVTKDSWLHRFSIVEEGGVIGFDKVHILVDGGGGFIAITDPEEREPVKREGHLSEFSDAISNSKGSIPDVTAMHNTKLVFVRYEGGEVCNMGILSLKTSLNSNDEVKAALVSATTHWVNTTKEGRELWDDSCEDLNIGDLDSGSAFKSAEFIQALKERGVEYVDCSLMSCDEALSFDEVLVNEAELTEEDLAPETAST